MDPAHQVPQRGSYGERHPSHLSKSLANEPPSRFPSGAPMKRDACHQSLLLHNLQGPQSRRPPLGSLHRVPIERDAPFSELFNYLSEFPVNGPP